MGYKVAIIAGYASTDDKKEAAKNNYEENLYKLSEQINSHKEIILLGDFNARIGRRTSEMW